MCNFELVCDHDVTTEAPARAMGARAAATDEVSAGMPIHCVSHVLSITPSNQLAVELEGVAECMTYLKEIEASGSRLDVVGLMATPDEEAMMLPSLLMDLECSLSGLEPGLWFVSRRRKSSAWAPAAMLLLVATPGMLTDAMELQHQATPSSTTASVLSHLTALVLLLASQLLFSFNRSLSNHPASLLVSTVASVAESLLYCKTTRSTHACEAPSLFFIMQNAAAMAVKHTVDANSKAASITLREEFRKWSQKLEEAIPAPTGVAKKVSCASSHPHAVLQHVFMDQELVAMPEACAPGVAQLQPAASTLPPSRAPSLGCLSRRSSYAIPGQHKDGLNIANHVAYAGHISPRASAGKLSSVASIQAQLASRPSQAMPPQAMPALHVDDASPFKGRHSGFDGTGKKQDACGSLVGSGISPRKSVAAAHVTPPSITPAFGQCLKHLRQRLEADVQKRRKHVMHQHITPLLVKHILIAYVNLVQGSSLSPHPHANHFMKLPSVKLKRGTSIRQLHNTSQNRSRPGSSSGQGSRPMSAAAQHMIDPHHTAAAAQVPPTIDADKATAQVPPTADADTAAAAGHAMAGDQTASNATLATEEQPVANHLHKGGHRPVPRKASRLRIAPGSAGASCRALQPVPSLPVIWEAVMNLGSQGAVPASLQDYQERMSILADPRDLVHAAVLHKQSWEAARRQYLDATTHLHSTASACGLRQLREQCYAVFCQLLQELQAAAAAEGARTGHRHRHRVASAHHGTNFPGMPTRIPAPAALGDQMDAGADYGVASSQNLSNAADGGSSPLHGRSKSSLSTDRMRRRLRLHELGLLVDTASRHKLQHAGKLTYARPSFAFLPRLGSFRSCPSKDILCADVQKNTGAGAGAGAQSSKHNPADDDFAEAPELKATVRMWEEHAGVANRTARGVVLPGIRRT